MKTVKFVAILGIQHLRVKNNKHIKLVLDIKETADFIYFFPEIMLVH